MFYSSTCGRQNLCMLWLTFYSLFVFFSLCHVMHVITIFSLPASKKTKKKQERMKHVCFVANAPQWSHSLIANMATLLQSKTTQTFSSSFFWKIIWNFWNNNDLLLSLFFFQFMLSAIFHVALWFLGTVIQLFQGNLPSGHRGNTRVAMEGRVTMHTLIAILICIPYLFGAFGTQKLTFGMDMVCSLIMLYTQDVIIHVKSLS